MTAAAANTMKTTTEQFTASGNQALQDGAEKSLAAINNMTAQSKQNLEAVVASVTAATKGAEALGAQAMAYSKKTMEDGAAAMKTLQGAKSLQDVIEFQTAYAKSALENYLAEFNKASAIVSASVKDSLLPLNARVTATVEQIQAAR